MCIEDIFLELKILAYIFHANSTSQLWDARIMSQKQIIFVKKSKPFVTMPFVCGFFTPNKMFNAIIGNTKYQQLNKTRKNAEYFLFGRLQVIDSW